MTDISTPTAEPDASAATTTTTTAVGDGAAESDAKSAAADSTAEAASAAKSDIATARPDWLPAALWDEKAGKVAAAAEKYVDLDAGKVKVDALAKRAVDAERELNRIKDQMRPAKDYVIKVPDKAAVPELADPNHPIHQSFLASVRDGKLTEGQADLVLDNFFTAFDRTVEYEMERLAKSSGVSRDALKPRLELLGGRIAAIAKGDPETTATLHLWAASARGVEMLEAALDGTLARKAGSYVAAPGAGTGEGAGAGPTESDLYALKASKEYQAGDPKARAKAKEMLQALYGGRSIETAHVSGPAR